jgi:hypothetical protein
LDARQAVLTARSIAVASWENAPGFARGSQSTLTEFTMSMLKLVEVPPPIEDATGQMARYGITRVPVDYFHFREFRYTSFADALAQAQRQAERDGMTAQTR